MLVCGETPHLRDFRLASRGRKTVTLYFPNQIPRNFWKTAPYYNKLLETLWTRFWKLFRTVKLLGKGSRNLLEKDRTHTPLDLKSTFFSWCWLLPQPVLTFTLRIYYNPSVAWSYGASVSKPPSRRGRSRQYPFSTTARDLERRSARIVATRSTFMGAE